MAFSFEVLVCSGHQLDLREDLRALPVVTMNAASDELITDVGLRAQTEYGADWEWRYYQFVTVPDAEGRRYQAPFRGYPDEQGIVHWRKHGVEGIRVADLERAADEDLFQGDPHALLIEEPLGGDGLIPVWDDLYRLLEHIAVIGGASATLAKSARGLQTIFDNFGRQWRARNAMPTEFLHMILERQAWDYGRLARFLGLNLETTLAMLDYLGYVKDKTDPRLYRRSADPDSEALRRRIIDEFMYRSDPLESREQYWRFQGREPPPFVE
jgi:hypothetical protein